MRTKLIILAAIAFILILGFWGIMSWDSFSRTRELIRSQELVERNNSVLHEIDGLENSLQDAREAALHYVLTPETQDLVTFEDAVAWTWMRLDRVGVMTKDDKGYPERVEQLRGWIKEELQQSRGNMRTTHTLLIFHTPDADRNRDRVRDGIRKFKDDQEALLSQRNETARAKAREVERSVMVRVSVFSLLMAFLFLLVILEVKRLFIPQQRALNAQARGASS